MNGDVPISRVAGYCNRNASKASGCLRKNETDKFNRAYAGYSRPVAIARIMRLKHHVYRAFELMRSHVGTHRGGRPYDVVVRVRPDSWFDNQLTAARDEPFTEQIPLDAAALGALTRAGMLIVPREWSWGGLNDRFAMGGYEQMRLYASQYVHMQEGWPSGERAQDCPGWIHSESFLRCTLVRHGVTFLQLPIGFFLVRADGRKQVLGHMVEGGLHSCSCVSWPLRDRPPSKFPEWDYLERCGKSLNLTTIANDPLWTRNAFEGKAFRYLQEKPCKGARWWRNGVSSGHHEWGS